MLIFATVGVFSSEQRKLPEELLMIMYLSKLYSRWNVQSVVYPDNKRGLIRIVSTYV